MNFYVLNFVIFHLIFVTEVLSQQKATQKCEEYGKKKRDFHKQIKRYVLGGTKSKKEEFPHMVALGFGDINGIEWNCGGTLISEDFVLTAAHCESKRDTGSVKFAKLGTTILNGQNTGLTVKIKKIITHPGFNPPGKYNDILLLQLESRINFSNDIFPACLAIDFSSKQEMSVIGWGSTEYGGKTSDDLITANLILYSHKDCKDTYSNMDKRKLPRGIDSRSQICAGGNGSQVKDTCQGDSGGPLQIKQEDMFYIVGITSFGKGCGIPEVPGIYTRVSAYIPWIEQNVWG